MATDVVSSVNNVTGLLFICRLDCPPFSQSSALNPAWKSVIEESLLVGLDSTREYQRNGHVRRMALLEDSVFQQTSLLN